MPKTVASFITKFKYKEIKQVLKKAHYSYSSPELDIKISPPTDNIGKLLIIIPKKVGNAPARNLIRRRLKSIFYENQLYKHLHNFLVFCKPPIVNMEFEALKNTLINVFSREKSL